jgi:hypothetical protein
MLLLLLVQLIIPVTLFKDIAGQCLWCCFRFSLVDAVHETHHLVAQFKFWIKEFRSVLMSVCVGCKIFVLVDSSQNPCPRLVSHCFACISGRNWWDRRLKTSDWVFGCNAVIAVVAMKNASLWKAGKRERNARSFLFRSSAKAAAWKRLQQLIDGTAAFLLLHSLWDTQHDYDDYDWENEFQQRQQLVNQEVSQWNDDGELFTPMPWCSGK